MHQELIRDLSLRLDEDVEWHAAQFKNLLPWNKIHVEELMREICRDEQWWLKKESFFEKIRRTQEENFVHRSRVAPDLKFSMKDYPPTPGEDFTYQPPPQSCPLLESMRGKLARIADLTKDTEPSSQRTLKRYKRWERTVFLESTYSSSDMVTINEMLIAPMYRLVMRLFSAEKQAIAERLNEIERSGGIPSPALIPKAQPKRKRGRPPGSTKRNHVEDRQIVEGWQYVRRTRKITYAEYAAERGGGLKGEDIKAAIDNVRNSRNQQDRRN